MASSTLYLIPSMLFRIFLDPGFVIPIVVILVLTFFVIKVNK